MSSKAMSLKGKIKNYAKSKSIAAQVCFAELYVRTISCKTVNVRLS